MDTNTLLVAHYLLIRAIDVLDKRFQIEIGDDTAQCWEDYKKIWLVNRKKSKK
jgi:hypothetical protein